VAMMETRGLRDRLSDEEAVFLATLPELMRQMQAALEEEEDIATERCAHWMNRLDEEETALVRLVASLTLQSQGKALRSVDSDAAAVLELLEALWKSFEEIELRLSSLAEYRQLLAMLPPRVDMDEVSTRLQALTALWRALLDVSMMREQVASLGREAIDLADATEAIGELVSQLDDTLIPALGMLPAVDRLAEEVTMLKEELFAAEAAPVTDATDADQGPAAAPASAAGERASLN